MSATVAKLICIQWRIYLQWYVVNIEVGVQQANDADWWPQYTPTCLESSDCARTSQWMQKNQFCSILTFKTVLQSAPEDVIFIKKIEKFSGKGAQPRALPQREGGTPSSTYPPRRLNPSVLQNPRYAIVHVDQFINCCRAQSLHGVPNAHTHRPRNVRRL